MTLRRLVANFDRLDRRAHELFEQILNRCEQRFVFQRDTGLRCEREQHALVALGERRDDAFGHRRRCEDQIEIGLAVDQHDDADDGVLVIAHRHGEHRLRAIAVLLVERWVEAILRGFGNFVGVGNAHDVAGEGDVAGDRAARERQHRAEMGAGVGRSGLRDGEAQRGVGAFVRFEQEEAARIRAREFARIAHDEFVQLRNVAFRRERDADREQPIRLARHVGGHLVEFAARAACGEEPARGGNGCNDGGGIERTHDPAGDVFALGEPHQRRVAGLRDDDRRGVLVRLDQFERVRDLFARAQSSQALGFDEIRDADIFSVAGHVGERARTVRDSGGVEGKRK